MRIPDKIKRIALFVAILLINPLQGQSRRQLAQVEKLLAEDRMEEARELLDRLKDENPEDPGVLYLRGLFEQDADRAIYYYEQLYRTNKSLFLDDVLLKMGQYHYSLGNYSRSKRYHALLTSRFPDSKLADDASYLFCQNLIAQDFKDSARVCLKKFIRRYPRSPFVDLVVLDLESHELWTTTEDQTVSLSKYRYTLQVGAFRWLSNAKEVADDLEAEGFDVEIYEKYVEDDKYFVVWVEKFETRALAQNFAERFNSMWENYHIVEISN
ncbi:tetratricopeptide repeat protein [candidate division KSB1 bacterium]|nr:tetratricopeptide repeat protein [candidate division KSB1 bacterium]